jgi:hypothetical protein
MSQKSVPEKGPATHSRIVLLDALALDIHEPEIRLSAGLTSVAERTQQPAPRNA